ncbi:cytochrome P450 [Fistulina hepatica ATCC 64428]|uniref:Cytochrome P450 n=1 Tax=Fistulina hepatica ATCC 64428 TaxID=1128425 RepID=A0A0D7A7S6_9AGAR|nr:cytochrome P450 [Fistulina hepatica ATCC 64428]
MVSASLFPAGLLILAAVLVVYARTRKELPLPPGPPSLPVVGNIVRVPAEKAWETLAQWTNQYGDLVFLHGFGQNILSVNSLPAAKALLDKKSSIYSDRPQYPILSLSGLSELPIVMGYSASFRYRRKLIHQAVGSAATVHQYYPHMEAEVKSFMRRLLDAPDELREHINYVASGIILRSTYGHTVTARGDSFLQAITAIMEELTVVMVPTSFLVNLLPILRHVPSWAPGAAFKRLAQRHKERVMAFLDMSYAEVREQVAASTAQASFAAKLTSNNEDETVTKFTSFMLYGGAVCTMLAFFKAMTLFPEAQARAQAEIDAVVGTDRFPTFEDRAQMIYMNALVLEVYRWHVALPSGFPHRLMEDDTYDGFFIQAGTVVMPNTLKISKDPQLYKDPHLFEPRRFIADGGFSAQAPEPDPREYIFGHGRRRCAGQAFAEASKYLEIVTTLAFFTISKAVDENGDMDEPTLEYMPGLISMPSPFRCCIKHRSKRAEALIRGGSEISE